MSALRAVEPGHREIRVRLDVHSLGEMDDDAALRLAAEQEPAIEVAALSGVKVTSYGGRTYFRVAAEVDGERRQVTFKHELAAKVHREICVRLNVHSLGEMDDNAALRLAAEQEPAIEVAALSGVKLTSPYAHTITGEGAHPVAHQWSWIQFLAMAAAMPTSE